MIETKKGNIPIIDVKIVRFPNNLPFDQQPKLVTCILNLMGKEYEKMLRKKYIK